MNSGTLETCPTFFNRLQGGLSGLLATGEVRSYHVARLLGGIAGWLEFSGMVLLGSTFFRLTAAISQHLFHFHRTLAATVVLSQTVEYALAAFIHLLRV